MSDLKVHPVDDTIERCPRCFRRDVVQYRAATIERERIFDWLPFLKRKTVTQTIDYLRCTWCGWIGGEEIKRVDSP